jgi:hypothetical protein
MKYKPRYRTELEFPRWQVEKWFEKDRTYKKDNRVEGDNIPIVIDGKEIDLNKV